MSEQKSLAGPEAPPLTPQGAAGGSQGGERSGGDQVARDILTTQQSLTPTQPTTRPDHVTPSNTGNNHGRIEIDPENTSRNSENQPNPNLTNTIGSRDRSQEECNITSEEIGLALREYRHRHRLRYLQEKADEQAKENKCSSPKQSDMKPPTGNRRATWVNSSRDIVAHPHTQEIFIKPRSLFSDQPRDLKNPRDRRAMMTPSLYVHGALKMMRRQGIPYSLEDIEIMRERTFNILRGSNYRRGQLITFRSNGERAPPITRWNQIPSPPSLNHPDAEGVEVSDDEESDTDASTEEESDTDDSEEEESEDDEDLIFHDDEDITDILLEEVEEPRDGSHEVEPEPPLREVLDEE